MEHRYKRNRTNAAEVKEALPSLFLFLIAIVISSGMIPGRESAGAQTAETVKDACVTAQCHSGIDRAAFVHGPVAAGQCRICHGESPKHAEDPKKHRFVPVADISKTCYSCHEKFPPRKYMHYPVAGGECTACHSPHGSPYKFQLVNKGGDLCLECHDESMIQETFVHGPVAVGGCIACHDPHVADYPANLRAEGPALCYMCHTDKAETILKSEFVHKPVSENCTKCHDPHSAPKQFMLQSGLPALCYECHVDKKEQVAEAAVKHGAVDTGKSCLNCHDAHNSGIARVLLMESMDLCMSCHDREYRLPDGSMLMDMKKLLAENTDHHGPIRQKDCSGCHNPHGSASFRILREPYPASFYMPFSVENYKLCFSCHEKTIVLDQETTTLTNFRNGNINLHFTHVNKPVKGRTCRACHETHASNFPRHIRAAVPFGEWELPVNFQKTETGGSCTPGCHKLKQYDRVEKMINR